MKTMLRNTAAFVLGGASGFLVAYLSLSPTTTPSPMPTVSSPSLSDSDVLASLKKQNALLEATVSRLQTENQALQSRDGVSVDDEANDENRARITQNLKDQWVQEIMSQSNPQEGQRYQSEMLQLQQHYHLTADQMLQLEPLIRQREQLSKMIMMRHLGLISEEEFNARIATAREFNFDQALTNLLSDDQKNLYQERQETNQNIGLNVVAFSFAERYRINDPERFTAGQQASIQGLFKKALGAPQDLVIPSSIQELDIDIMEKRMLTLGYQELDEETFEKMYQAIADHRRDQ